MVDIKTFRIVRFIQIYRKNKCTYNKYVIQYKTLFSIELLL